MGNTKPSIYAATIEKAMEDPQARAIIEKLVDKRVEHKVLEALIALKVIPPPPTKGPAENVNDED